MYLRNEPVYNPTTKRNTKTHFLKCDLCGIEFNPKMKEPESVLRKKLNFCGKTCQTESTKKGGLIDQKYKQTCLESYGTISVQKLEEIQSKRKISLVEKYGKESYFQTEEFFKKQKETNLKKFGVEFAAQAQINKDKQAQGYIKKYGVSSPLKNKKILEKKNKTMLKRFGVEHSLQNPELKKKRNETCIERYGTEHPFELNEFQEKYKQTCLTKYGVESFSQTKEFMDNYKCSFYFDQGHDIFLGKEFYYRSSYEKRFINKLKEFESHFIEFEPNIRFEYEFQRKKHYYFVDFYLKTIDGTKILIELKGEYLLKKEQTETKINHVKTVYNEHGYDLYCVLKLMELNTLETFTGGQEVCNYLKSLGK